MGQREFFRVAIHGKTKLMLTLYSTLRILVASDIAFKIGKTFVNNCSCASVRQIDGDFTQFFLCVHYCKCYRVGIFLNPSQ